MPKNFQPNQYQYYPTPTSPDGYPMLSKVLGCTFSASDQNKAIAKQSTENLKALCKSQMPNKADKPSELEKLFQLAPELKANGNRKARRRLSEQARDIIAKCAAEKERSMQGIPVPHRHYYVLCAVGDPDIPLVNADNPNVVETVRTRNEQYVRDKIVNATPAQRGKEVEKAINEAMKYFDVLKNSVNGTYPDEYFIENFEALANVQNVFVNACNFLSLADSDDDAIRIEITQEVRDTLKLMEFYSALADLPLQKARMIANANYELVNFEYLYTASRREVENIANFLGSETILPRVDSMAQFDIITNTVPVVTWAACANGTSVADKIETAFAKDPKQPKVKAINQHNNIETIDFSKEPGFTNAIGRNLGYVFAYTDDKSVCYRMDPRGRTTEVEAKDILNDMSSEIDEALKIMQNANKGMFIGSAEFNNSLNAMIRMSKDLHNKNFPLIGDADLKTQLNDTIALCKQYMEKKNPTDDPYEDVTFANFREETRFLAIRQAVWTCEHQLKMIQVQEESLAIEAQIADRLQQKEEIRGWRYKTFNTKDMPLNQFVDFLQAMEERGRIENASDVLNSEGCTAKRYLTVMTQDLESKVASSILTKANELAPEAKEQFLTEQRDLYTHMISGLSKFVVNHTNQDALISHCRNPQQGSPVHIAMLGEFEDFSANGVTNYTEQLVRENAQNENAPAQNNNVVAQNNRVLEANEPIQQQANPMIAH